MLTWIARRFLDTFEREWSYDVSYAREILDVGGYEALAPINGIQKAMSYKRDLPADILFTSRIVTTRAGDCGPCLQLVVKMAQRGGVSDKTIAAVLSGDRDAMTDDVRLAYDFTRAVLARDGWDGPAREALLSKYGKRAMISLAYAIATARFYPDFKYAIGAGHACSIVRVGNVDVVPQPV
jgi:alkylhydroperoxidase family enzyme